MVSERWDDIEIDRTVPHAGRMYDYMLGGTTHFEADVAASIEAGKAFPGGIEAAKVGIRANRDFLGRAVRFMAEAGIRQFLDLGTGIPGDDNTHAVALSVAPDSRIVYVDNDPIVLAHAHELLHGGSDQTSYLFADVREPDKILAAAAETLDLAQPVALVLVAVLHFVTDEEDAHGLVRQLVDAVPSGSYLAISHLASDVVAGMTELYDGISAKTRETFVLRDRAEFARFFDRLDMVEPGVSLVSEWHTDAPGEVELPFYAGVARKP